MAADPRRAPPDRGHASRCPRGHRAGAASTSLTDQALLERVRRATARRTSPTRSRASRASASTPSASAARSRSSAARSRTRCARSTISACPPVIRNLAEEQRGIVLLTGTTGSGKSTTLAAMIDHINSTVGTPHHHARGSDRVPAPRQALDHQPARGRPGHRELRPRDAPRAAPGPRRDPVGEMRDEETVRTALSAAETGHLVLSTLHTLDATETINRIIDFFPPHLQQQARVMLAATLRGRRRPAPRPERRRARPRRGLRGARRDRPRART